MRPESICIEQFRKIIRRSCIVAASRFRDSRSDIEGSHGNPLQAMSLCFADGRSSREDRGISAFLLLEVDSRRRCHHRFCLLPSRLFHSECRGRVEIDLDFIFHLGNAGTATGYTAAAALATALSTPLTSVTGYDRVRFTQVEAGVPSFEDDSWSIVERYRAIAHDT